MGGRETRPLPAIIPRPRNNGKHLRCYPAVDNGAVVDEERALGGWLLAAALSALFVLLAVGLEVMGGLNANSPLPSWAKVVPIAWPPAARVAWWVTVAAAAGLFRLALHRLGFRQRAWLVIASIVPFLIFAAGVAGGADWATWH